MFNFGLGNLKFRIKIPANVSFQIGIIDAWGNQNYVEFPASQTTYGLVRNGEWGQASIPVEDIRGLLIDLRMLSYEFVILEKMGNHVNLPLTIFTGMEEHQTNKGQVWMIIPLSDWNRNIFLRTFRL